MKKLDWKRIGGTALFTPLLILEIAGAVFLLSFVPIVCGYNFASMVFTLFLMLPLSASIFWTLGKIYFYYHPRSEEEKEK